MIRNTNDPAPTAALPILHRLAIFYLVLPMAIFLVGWFHWWFGIPAAALLVAGLWKTLQGSWRPSWPRPATTVLLAIALGWVMVTAAGGVLDTHNSDWMKHRSVLTDLALHPWPVRLPDPLAAFLVPALGDSNGLLRYYLGYYALPGLLGSWFGPAALNWALPLWTWLGVALLVLLFAARFAGNRAPIVAAAVLVVFSGMDVLRFFMWFGEVPLFSSLHLEEDDVLRYRIQYSSTMTALMWVPQHFLASGLSILLLLHLRKTPRFLASIGIPLAACLFWSPFAALGLLPFLVVLVLGNGLRPFLTWQNLLLATPLAALVAAYLTSDAATIVRNWLWQDSPWGELIRWLPVFLLTEFLVLVSLLWLWRPQLLRNGFFVASVATLLVLPFYRFGYFNDLGMRASLPALLVLCGFCAEMVASHPLGAAAWRGWLPWAKKRRQSAVVRQQSSGAEAIAGPPSWRRNVVFGMVLALLTVGAVTPLHELIRALSITERYRFETELPSISTNTVRPVWRQFVADDLPFLLDRLLPAPDEVVGGQDPWRLVVRSHFDVYVKSRMLLYTRIPCTNEDVTPWFFVDVWPARARDLAEARRLHGFNRVLHDLVVYTLWNGQRCAVIRKLPEYPIERVATGQLEGGRRLWQGTFSLAPPKPAIRP